LKTLASSKHQKAMFYQHSLIKNMLKTITVAEWLEKKEAGRILLDVRTPAEFEKGHIPGAKSFPLFSNEERIKVGTLYKKVSPESALLKGLDFVGPKMSGFIKWARKLSPKRKVCLHCWRGGKRSGSLSWLLSMAGFDVQVIQGGYKKYRQTQRQNLVDKPYQFYVLGGRTGCGKTAILHAIAKQEQMIDLEGLANHKGSAFGGLGELPQPSVEQFENNLLLEVAKQDVSKRIWLENESKSIGRIFLPETFWAKMKEAPLINVERSFDERVQILVDVYAGYNPAGLKKSFNNIAKRLGGQHVKTALEALDNNDFSTAAAIALRYYDKAYQYMLENNPSPNIVILNVEGLNATEAAEKVLNAAG